MKQSVTMQLPAHFNTPDSHMGFDCIVSRALLVLNFHSNSFLLVLKLYVVQTEALGQAVYSDDYAHFSEITNRLLTWWLF